MRYELKTEVQHELKEYAWTPGRISTSLVLTEDFTPEDLVFLSSIGWAKPTA